MSKAAPARPIAEITALIGSFGAADWIRLRKIARYYSFGGMIESDDLLQEALRRTIEGGRACPGDVPPITFLAGVMRSIADDERDRVRRRPKLTSIAQQGGGL